MDIVEEAFRLLYPDKEFNYETKVKYSGHFSDYGANIKIKGNIICLGMSKKWKEVSREIQIGLAQELLLKILGKRNKKELKNISTTYLDLYNSFIKNIHIAIPKTHIEPMLSESFDRVNEKYFYGLVEKPNLVWGGDSLRCLGSYDYKKDTIKISRIFEKLGKNDPDLLDIV
ncbi:MAG: hypothetical protein N3D84_03625, partial [Candidatus Woesearchaeota archaeon]|nr:hypothetical protein [Candidatus Woesearchaeota archaeon]